MPTQSYFARLRPEFVEQAGSARANARRHAQAEQLIDKAEYDWSRLRRELASLLSASAVAPAEAAAAEPMVEAAPAA